MDDPRSELIRRKNGAFVALVQASRACDKRRHTTGYALPEARRWLLSDPFAAYLCAAVDLDRAAVIRTVAASTRGPGRDG